MGIRKSGSALRFQVPACYGGPSETPKCPFGRPPDPSLDGDSIIWLRAPVSGSRPCSCYRAGTCDPTCFPPIFEDRTWEATLVLACHGGTLLARLAPAVRRPPRPPPLERDLPPRHPAVEEHPSPEAESQCAGSHGAGPPTKLCEPAHPFPPSSRSGTARTPGVGGDADGRGRIGARPNGRAVGGGLPSGKGTQVGPCRVGKARRWGPSQEHLVFLALGSRSGWGPGGAEARWEASRARTERHRRPRRIQTSRIA